MYFWHTSNHTQSNVRWLKSFYFNICSRVKKFLVPGVVPTIIILMSQFKDFSELQSLSSNGPILKVEQVRIVFCWLQTSHTLPTSTMSMSRSVQRECPLQWFSDWCSISVVLIPVLPLERKYVLELFKLCPHALAYLVPLIFEKWQDFEIWQKCAFCKSYIAFEKKNDQFEPQILKVKNMPKAARKSTYYSKNDKILKITMAGSTRNGVI